MAKSASSSPSLRPLPSLPRASRGPRAASNPCLCGCGQLTGGRFVPGHDSRLRGWTLRVVRGQVAIDAADAQGPLMTPGEQAAVRENIRLIKAGQVPLTHGIDPEEVAGYKG